MAHLAAHVKSHNKHLPFFPGKALKGTKGVNMYLDQRYYEPKGAFGRELFSDVCNIFKHKLGIIEFSLTFL